MESSEHWTWLINLKTLGGGLLNMLHIQLVMLETSGFFCSFSAVDFTGQVVVN